MDTEATDTLPLQIFIIAALIEVLLYGIHVVFFFICACIFFKNRDSFQLLIFASAVAMFALSTADIAVSFHAMTQNVAFLLGFDYIAFMDALYPKMPIFVANNFVADVILLYRCYMVWGQRKYVIILSSILILADTVWGWIGVFNKDNIFYLRGKYSPVYLWTVFCINIIMTAATAGRIYWVARTAQPIAGGVHMKAYRTAMAILVESGAIYSISVLLFVLYSSTIYMYIPAVFCMRLVGIMPTALIVQVWLGRGARNNPTTIVSTIQCRQEGQASSVILDTFASSQGQRHVTFEVSFQYPLSPSLAEDTAETMEYIRANKYKAPVPALDDASAGHFLTR